MPVKVGLKYIEIWKESMEDRICEYEKEVVDPGQIVFYGPSNFTRWSARHGMIPMREQLLGASGKQCVVNRGFGSSCSEHQLYYYPRMIRPLAPKVLVYSPCGNYSAFGYSEEEAWEIAQRVIVWAKTDFPDIRIYLCGGKKGLKTTPERLEKIKLFNSWLEQYAAENENVFYLDSMNYEPLQRTDIFVADGVHYNQDGYNLYADYFREMLKDELAQF